MKVKMEVQYNNKNTVTSDIEKQVKEDLKAQGIKMNAIKTLDIYFKHEVKYGDDIISSVKIDRENLTSEHLITDANTGEEVCLLKASYVAI